jgi:hypothetical protein
MNKDDKKLQVELHNAFLTWKTNNKIETLSLYGRDDLLKVLRDLFNSSYVKAKALVIENQELKARLEEIERT